MKIRKTILASAMLATSCFAAAVAQAQVNQIYNPGFEMGPTRPNNNLFINSNTGNAVGWMDGGGQQLNVVQVDGPGGWNSGNNGPESDKTGPAGTTQPRRYLDIANGTNSVFQRFTPRCNGEVKFGAWFTNRAGLSGTSRIRLLKGSAVQGVLPTLPVVATTGNVNINVPNTQFAPWVEGTGSASLIAGQTYSFYVDLDNNMNMDEAYLYFPNCNEFPDLPDVPDPKWPTDGNVDFPRTDPVIGLSACCGPWHEGLIPQSLQPQFPATANDPFNMQYQTPAAFDAAMKAYLLYVNSMVPTITEVKLVWQAANLGTGATPSASGPSIASGGTIKWTISGSTVTTSGAPMPNWPSAPFVKNTWYGFMTTLSHNGPNESPYFKKDCMKNWWYFRWNSQPFKTASGQAGGRFESFQNGAVTSADVLKAAR